MERPVRRHQRPQIGSRAHNRAQRVMLPMALGMLGALAIAGTGLYALIEHDAVKRSSALPATPVGESFDGRPLQAEHMLHTVQAERLANGEPGMPALALRRDCAWGRPSHQPYRGSVELALRTAALPEEVVQTISRRVTAGEADDELLIRTGLIEGQHSQRRFDTTNIAMTHGMSLCLGTRVNFVVGHEERAALYEATDRSGHSYSVMVPRVCGNVSVLSARSGEGGQRRPAGGRFIADGEVPGDPAPDPPAVLIPQGTGRAPAGSKSVADRDSAAPALRDTPGQADATGAGAWAKLE
jgi:hypothetical protein